MKVVVKEYLNVRIGKPSVNAPCHQYLAPGSEIEVDGRLYDGDLFEGISTWMKDASGNYYWSGGLMSFSATATNHPHALPWWITHYSIDQLWTRTRGESVTVILLDSGIVACKDLPKGRVVLKNNPGQQNGIDRIGHGTLMASIIGGNGSDIQGLAPACALISIKVTDDSSKGNITWSSLISGIKEIESLIKPAGKYIVNCSLELPASDPASEQLVISAINRLLLHPGANVVFVFAAGNNGPAAAIPAVPRYLQNSLSVAGLYAPGKKYKRLLSSAYWPGISVTAPGEFTSQELRSRFAGLSLAGSSHACAYVSGLLALFFSLPTVKKISAQSAQVLLDELSELASDIKGKEAMGLTYDLKFKELSAQKIAAKLNTI